MESSKKTIYCYQPWNGIFEDISNCILANFFSVISVNLLSKHHGSLKVVTKIILHGFSQIIVTQNNMTPKFFLPVQFTIMLLAVCFNGLGIFTFHKRTSGNKNQHLLLQNLATVEILKTTSDLVSLLLFYFYNNCYNVAKIFFMVIEINLMTLLYLSFVAVTVDRLLCVILEGRYRIHITSKNVKICVSVIWIATTFPGLILWAAFPILYKAKMCYYVIWDVVVVLVIVPTYVVVVNMVYNSSIKVSPQPPSPTEKVVRTKTRISATTTIT